ncbi:MAG: hypothetical protein HFE64_05435 [Lachnospiraceae bacterium]|jgi:hypothetical protein|nr:hypothetical protein [Lachnospiraceae bacterium]
MKKINRCIALLLMAAVCILNAAGVSAAEHEGEEGWLVTFDSERLVSNMETGEEFTEVLGRIQPGDTVTLRVALHNEASEATDWYMQNEVLNSFEKSVQASGGAYSYILSYIDEKGTETVIYNSNTVGGDEVIGQRVGLEQATISLTDYFYVATLKEQERGAVLLTVGLDGETNGNQYQNAAADLKMDFAVELSSLFKEPEVERRTENQYITVRTPGSTAGAKTGDTTSIWPYVGAGGAALLLIILLVCLKKRKGTQK